MQRSSPTELFWSLQICALRMAYAFQGKLHDTLGEHEGQLFASMHACREQYLRRRGLKKRKRDLDPMTQASASLTM